MRELSGNISSNQKIYLILNFNIDSNNKQNNFLAGGFWENSLANQGKFDIMKDNQEWEEYLCFNLATWRYIRHMALG